MCKKCNGEGVIRLTHMISNVEIKSAGPCTCGLSHGYHEYVKSKYSRKNADQFRIKGNLYKFPFEMRRYQIEKELEVNGGKLPEKCNNYNNVISLDSYR